MLGNTLYSIEAFLIVSGRPAYNPLQYKSCTHTARSLHFRQSTSQRRQPDQSCSGKPRNDAIPIFAMSDQEHVLCNRTTTSQPPQATKRRPGRLPVSRVILVAIPNDEPIAESSRGPAGCAATAGDHEVDLTDKAPPRAADPSAGPPISQH